MNKIFKLIYINLLNIFDINKIIIARSDGVKSNLEKRNILSGIILLAYVFIIFQIFNMFHLKDNYLLFNIAYIVSSIICLVSNMFIIEPLIFKNDENDILFSLPLSRQQILFSKFFSVYLRNLFNVLVFMISAGIVFYNTGTSINDTQVLMIVCSSLMLPIIPMILATIIAYVNDYFKIKLNNSLYYKVCRTLILILVLLLIYLLFSGINVSSLEDMLVNINDKIGYIYPFVGLFYIVITKTDILCFILLLIIPILSLYLYSLVISNNYLKICSMLKGVKRKEKFVYKKSSNLKVLFGLVRKEFINLFNNKNYLNSSVVNALLGSIILVIVLSLVDVNELFVIEPNLLLYLPPMVALITSLCCSTISSMSLEKNNLQIIRSMPISITKLLFSKWLVNYILGMFFVLLNGTFVWIFLGLTGFDVFFIYFVPMIAVMFVSLTGLVLDYRFIEKNETNDNAIIKQRLITLIPLCLSCVLGFGIFIMPYYSDYRIILACYMFIFIILMIIEIVYLLINNKKLVSNLIN